MASKTVAWIYRHTLAVRITHWINVLCLTLLLMSGLQIFNAHPALYWGKASRFDGAVPVHDGTRRPRPASAA